MDTIKEKKRTKTYIDVGFDNHSHALTMAILNYVYSTSFSKMKIYKQSRVTNETYWNRNIWNDDSRRADKKIKLRMNFLRGGNWFIN